MISALIDIGGKTSRGQYGLDVVSKDGRHCLFKFDARRHSRRELCDCIERHAFSGHEPLFAFSYRCVYERNGWDLCDIGREYQRILSRAGDGEGGSWRIDYAANASYALCASYPQILVLPRAFDVARLEGVASFRSKARVPVLTWLHPRTKAALLRSAQPLTGWLRAGSRDDEALLRAVLKASPKRTRGLHIADCRPRVNAVANTALGAGYEDVNKYDETDITFFSIANIHAVRESMLNVRALSDMLIGSTTVDGQYLANLQATRWLEHLRTILAGALDVVTRLDRDGDPVLVHCSDGWDRTSAIVSLAQLMLEPFYRTVTGFAVLIEKDWLAFGHKFAARCGHGCGKETDRQRSPIFLQWVDAVFQLRSQFPTAFEFNDALLVLLADEVYSCRFGTFLFNSPQERDEASVATRTVSLWSHVLSNMGLYLNPFYSPCDAVLCVMPRIYRLRLFEQYFLRDHPDTRPSAGHQLADVHLMRVAGFRQQLAEIEAHLLAVQAHSRAMQSAPAAAGAAGADVAPGEGV